MDGAEKMLIRAKEQGYQYCNGGGCHQNCTSEFRCYQKCKGRCPQHCTTGERCEQSCSIDGKCHQSCTSNSCVQSCDKGGNCNMTCKARDRCVQVLNNNNYNNGPYFHQIKIHILRFERKATLATSFPGRGVNEVGRRNGIFGLISDLYFNINGIIPRCFCCLSERRDSDRSPVSRV